MIVTTFDQLPVSPGREPANLSSSYLQVNEKDARASSDVLGSLDAVYRADRCSEDDARTDAPVVENARSAGLEVASSSTTAEGKSRGHGAPPSEADDYMVRNHQAMVKVSR
jgi:hypothetical protein